MLFSCLVQPNWQCLICRTRSSESGRYAKAPRDRRGGKRAAGFGRRSSARRKGSRDGGAEWGSPFPQRPDQGPSRPRAPYSSGDDERGRPKAARPEAGWMAGLSGPGVCPKASGLRWRSSDQDRDAQTASAHLTPFFDSEPSDTKRGPLPSATGPAVSRCDRVSCTCAHILTRQASADQQNVESVTKSCGKWPK